MLQLDKKCKENSLFSFMEWRSRGRGGNSKLKLCCAIYEWPFKKSIFTYSKNQLKKLKIIINRLHNRNKVALKKFKGLVMTAVLMASETTIG